MSIPYDDELAESQQFPIDDPDNGDGGPVFVTYEQFVTNLVKERGDRSMNLEHMVIGICGEAGEVADGIKKNSIYGKPLDQKNIIEELGDLEFYMAGLRQMLGISRYETLGANVRKLQARYKGGYSDAAAIERADKLPKAPADCKVIDVTSAEYKAANPPISDEQVAMVDEQAGIVHEPVVVEDWCLPLLAAYHAGKTVQAIAYTKNTATVLFQGDSNAYKLYKPKGEQ